MNKRFILHIDMNSYFASVEQQANPFLRGKPLGVCAYLSEHGTIIASSMEAKKFGVKTAMRVQDARVLCPELRLVENEPAKYRSVTEKIFSIFSDYSSTIEPYSIDEAFIDLTGHIQNEKQGLLIIEEIKERIRTEVGDWLKCSAGLSYTRWLAKFASDMAEKNDYSVITKENLEEKLDEADLVDAWGINVRIEARLHLLGIRSLLELKRAEPYLLIKHLGAYGYSLWTHVNGIEISRVRIRKEIIPKSIGHSYQVPARSGYPENFSRLLMKMCERTGRRMRTKGLAARHISISIGFRNHERFYKTHKLAYELYDTQCIYKAAIHLFGSERTSGVISFISVSVSGLQQVNCQGNLFDDRVKDKQLARALDSINNTYGEYTVYHGSMYGMEAHGKDRVGYRKTVDTNFEEKNALTYNDDY